MPKRLPACLAIYSGSSEFKHCVALRAESYLSIRWSIYSQSYGYPSRHPAPKICRRPAKSGHNTSGEDYYRVPSNLLVIRTRKQSMIIIRFITHKFEDKSNAQERLSVVPLPV
eukprot:5386784-Amphidinium_carterae.1